MCLKTKQHDRCNIACSVIHLNNMLAVILHVAWFT